MSPATLDNLDAQLLGSLQDQVPLVPRPFAAIAGALDVPEQVVLERLTELHAGPHAPVRQIGAIFDSKSLGYQSTLVAAKVPEDRLSQAVAAINAHPGVSHNYRRDHAYNLWFTLAVAPDSRLGLQKTAAVLCQRSGATEMRLMPTLKLYKIGVKLNLQRGTGLRPVPAASKFSNPFSQKNPGSGPVLPQAVSEQADNPSFPTERDKKLIRVLQQDLPIVQNPFDIWAKQAGVSVDHLLQAAEEFKARGIMRRFSAVLRHRELGFDANAMGVWVVPPARQDAFGATAAAFPEVSHCYLRPRYADWPYTVFTMIHTQDRARATGVLTAIAAATGIERYTALYSTHEFKKVRVQYFTGDAQAWEARVSTGEEIRGTAS